MSNKGAQEMYRRFGFAPVGVRKNYYQETNEDALVMWVHDIDAPEYARLLAWPRARACPATPMYEPPMPPVIGGDVGERC